MKNLNSLLILLTLSACVPPLTPSPPPVSTTPDPGAASSAGLAPTPIEAPTQPVQALTPEDPTDQPVSVSLAYYKRTLTTAPVSGWSTKTVTLNGMCILYRAQTYCWDDGVKSLAWTDFNGHAYGPFTYSYFALSTVGPCSGGCGIDALSQPTLMTATIEAGISVQGNSTTNNIFNLGAAVPVTCNETDAKLDCGIFVINR